MLVELPKDKVKLNRIEELIIEKRLSGVSFCQIEESDLRSGIDHLILKASAITGCDLPQTEFFAEVLTTEIIEFVNEFDYRELTLAEMIFSIRLNSRIDLRFPSGNDIEQVVFSGRHFNINFFSRVLHNYAQLRKSLDRKFQNHIDGY